MLLCWHDITKLADIRTCRRVPARSCDRNTNLKGAHCRLERCLTDNTTKAPTDCQRNQLNLATACNCMNRSWTKRVMSNKSNNVAIASAAHQSCISWVDDLTASCRWRQPIALVPVAAIWDMHNVCNNQINCRHRRWLQRRQLKWIHPPPIHPTSGSRLYDLYKCYRRSSQTATHWRRRRRRQLISDSSNNKNNIKTALRLQEKEEDKRGWSVLIALAVSACCCCQRVCIVAVVVLLLVLLFDKIAALH